MGGVDRLCRLHTTHDRKRPKPPKLPKTQLVVPSCHIHSSCKAQQPNRGRPNATAIGTIRWAGCMPRHYRHRPAGGDKLPPSSRQKIPLQVDSFDVDDYRTGDSPSIALLQYATDKQRRPGTRKRSVGTSIVLRALLVSVVKMETNARRAMDRRNKRSHDHATASPSPK